MCVAYFTETELSETLTEKGGKMEESNDQHDSEQEKEGKERREGREGETLVGNCIVLQRLSYQRL